MTRLHVSMRAAFLLLAFVAVPVGCGRQEETRPIGTGETVVHTVGTLGASITLEDVTLTIPPGALDAEEEIRITSTFDVPDDGVTNYTPIFKFEPEGLTFRHPVEAQFTLEEDAPADTVVFWSNDVRGGFDQLETRVEGKNVYAFTTHFSSAFAGQGSNTDAGTQADAGSQPDAGIDAGTWDAGSDAGWDAGSDAGWDAGSDAGLPTDGGSAGDGGFFPPDAGADAGIPGDGGTWPDGGTVFDGGSAPDGGTWPDGGTSLDGGTPTDGGTGLDAGAPLDAGTALDAGSAPDAG